MNKSNILYYIVMVFGFTLLFTYCIIYSVARDNTFILILGIVDSIACLFMFYQISSHVATETRPFWK